MAVKKSLNEKAEMILKLSEHNAQLETDIKQYNAKNEQLEADVKKMQTEMEQLRDAREEDRQALDVAQDLIGGCYQDRGEISWHRSGK